MVHGLVEELVGLSDVALVERIRANELERRRLDAELAAALAIADRRGVKEIDGFGAAWFDGRFGLAQATQLSKLQGNRRVRHRLTEFAPILLEHAERLPYSDIARVVDHFVANADVDGAHDDRDEAIEGRRARVTDVGGQIEGLAAVVEFLRSARR